LAAEEWFAFRDRSWGVRQYAGATPADLQPPTKDWVAQSLHYNWIPAILHRPDGTCYYLRDTPAAVHADGSQTPVRRVMPSLRYGADNRSLLGGSVAVLLDDAHDTERRFEVEPLGDTSFRLWPALYQQ
jgi:hypothetical protein